MTIPINADEDTLSRRRAYKRAWYDRNKEQQHGRERARIAAGVVRYRDPVKRRDARLRKDYGIEGLAHWEAIFDAQGRKCACCAAVDPGSARGWHVDHDHSNPKPNYRSILCAPCNIAIGNAKECSSRLRACASYLDEHAGS